jgi:hypothetical protein
VVNPYYVEKVRKNQAGRVVENSTRERALRRPGTEIGGEIVVNFLIPEALASVQVAINNVARSVVGHKREDHIPIVDLLEVSKFLSLNQQVV